VEAVRGYAAHEKALLTSVAELRSAAVAAKPGVDAGRFDSERALGAKLKQLLVLQEAYPQLKADAGFRDLSAKLVEVEDHLQSARRFYNGAVKQYRDRQESFPHVLVARAFGFAPLPFFETDDREAVKVQL
jgi:LemA protein